MDMLKCDLCGKEFKNKAGLGGHKAYTHGVAKQSKRILPGRVASLESYLAKMDKSLSELFLNIEGRLKKLEGSAGLHSGTCKIAPKSTCKYTPMLPAGKCALPAPVANLAQDKPEIPAWAKDFRPGAKGFDDEYLCKECGCWHTRWQKEEGGFCWAKKELKRDAGELTRRNVRAEGLEE
jgi:hypothetical protein